LPVISSIILAPPTAHASPPCFPIGHPCTRRGECCSGVCVLNRCA
jgi:hypothetical protein